MPDDINAVAEALRARLAESGAYYDPVFDHVDGEVDIDDLAQAAIDALGLKTEWGWQLGDNTPSVYPTEQQARDRVTYLDSVFQVGTERHVVHRYTTPWAREDTG